MKLISGAKLAVLATSIAFTGAASAFTVDGDLSDWIGTPSGNASDWTPTSSSTVYNLEQDSTGPNSVYLNPGWGGQHFDAEAMYLAWDNTNLYYAVVTGLPSTESSLPSGDIAFDFGNDGSWEYGIEVLGNNGLTVGGLYGPAATWDDPVNFPTGQPWDLKAGNSGNLIDTGSLVYSTTAVTGLGAYTGDSHYVIEGSIALNNFSGHFGESFNVHWTMKCGNDQIQLDPSVNFPGSSTEAPVPGTLALFGAMFLGLAGIRRRRRA